MRTNPNQGSPNPAKRFFNWDGSEGDLKYYDKELEKETHVSIPFEFILLDRLAVVRGWHDASESGITSNEVRRITDEPLTVRAFKMKEPIARGLYQDIKDKVKSVGGRFNTNLYIAYTEDTGDLQIGSLMLHGAAMSAWFEFENNKEIKPYLYKRGISILSYVEGKKGAIKFRVPQFQLVNLPEDVDEQAGKLQDEIKDYLSRYFAKSESKQEKEDVQPDQSEIGGEVQPQEDEDEIPF